MTFGTAEIRRAPHSKPLLDSGTPTYLSYNQLSPADYGLKHSRYDNTTVLVPDFDVKEYSRSIGFDFIDIQISPVNSKANFKTIRQHLFDVLRESVRVDLISTATDDRNLFNLRIQNFKPKKHRQLEKLFATKLLLHCQPKITTVELSLDFSPKNISYEAFAKMFGILVRHHVPIDVHFRTRDDRLRMVQPQENATVENKPIHLTPLLRDIRTSKVSRSLLPEPLLGATIYAGQRGAAYASWRIMHKELDNQNPQSNTSTNLPIEQQRARIEVTLGMDALNEIGLTEFRGLRGFNFRTGFSKFFQFMVPVFKNSPDNKTEKLRHTITEYLDKSSFFAQGTYRLSQRSWERGVRSKHIFKGRDVPAAPAQQLVAFKEMNTVVHSLLGSLGRSYQ